MKRIPLTQGQFAIVDDEDYEWLSRISWRVQRRGKNKFYARTEVRDPKSGAFKTVAMHTLILEPRPGMDVDHINRDSLDNRRENLRAATKAQNMMNRAGWGRCGYHGVVKDKRVKTFKAQIHANGRDLYLGSFATPQEAARAYDAAARKYFGEFAVLNGV